MPRRLNPDPELEALIQQLNDSKPAEGEKDLGAAPVDGSGTAAAAHWSLPARRDEGVAWLDRLLAMARDAHASDLLLVFGAVPALRINGGLDSIGEQALAQGACGMLAAALVPAHKRATLESKGSADFAISRSGIGRLRCNVHRARGHWAASIRLLPQQVPDLAELNLPQTLNRFAELRHGLVLVTGPTGSGKSTTLAALMKQVLSKRRVHVITIEDPVEYTYNHGDSVVEHVEIGRDAPSFAAALRSVLRQDPDVLLIGEMRDPESISIAITAAETGHLVLSTLHTGDAPQTIHRILDSYPAAQLEQVRTQLSISLAGIVSQQLLPRKDESGRVPALEVMIVTHAVRNLIRQGKVAHLRSQLVLERNAGMLTLEQSLAALVKRGLIEVERARVRARVPEDFDRLV